MKRCSFHNILRRLVAGPVKTLVRTQRPLHANRSSRRVTLQGSCDVGGGFEHPAGQRLEDRQDRTGKISRGGLFLKLLGTGGKRRLLQKRIQLVGFEIEMKRHGSPPAYDPTSIVGGKGHCSNVAWPALVRLRKRPSGIARITGLQDCMVPSRSARQTQSVNPTP